MIVVETSFFTNLIYDTTYIDTITGVVNNMDIDSGRTRVAIVNFGSTIAEIAYPFGSLTSRAQVNQAIRGLERRNTGASSAFSTMLFSLSGYLNTTQNSNPNQVVLLFTAGYYGNSQQDVSRINEWATNVKATANVIGKSNIRLSLLCVVVFYFVLLCFTLCCCVILCVVVLYFVLLCFTLCCGALLCVVVFYFVLLCFSDHCPAGQRSSGIHRPADNCQ